MSDLSVAAPRSGCETAELQRYLALSAAALAVDVVLLWALASVVGLPYLMANGIAFVIASIVAYLGSVAWVFRHRRFDNRTAEYLIFVAIGIAGLTVNEAGLWLGVELMVLPLLAAKAFAAGTSFAFNYALRKVVLFS